MPNKIKNCFDENLTFEKMLEAHERAKQGKLNRYEVLKFDLNLESNIVNLVENIKNNRYKTGAYRSFTVYEPKERIIKALPYVDRVLLYVVCVGKVNGSRKLKQSEIINI